LKALITEICEAVGPRIAGSPQEAQAAQLIAQRLEAVADEVTIEEVPIHIGVLAGLTNLLVAGVLLAAVLYWFVPLLAVVLLPLVLLIIYLSRPRGKDVIDFLFPKGVTQNVVATLHPTGPVKRRVIFSGHHDSAYRMPLLNPPWKRYAYTLQNLATAAVIWLTVVALAKTVAQFLGWPFLWVGIGRWAPGDWLMLPGLVGVGLAIFFRQMTVTKTPVLGAGDNLSAVAVAVRVLEVLAAARPQHTEVWAVSFGAEEIGAKGSRAFIDRHASDLQGAYVINLETLGGGELGIIEREVSVLTSHAPEAIALLQRAGQRVGVQLPTRVIKMGDTDATPFSRRGFWAATLYGMDETGLFVFWHTEADNVENISPDNLQRALDVCLAVAAELEDEVQPGLG
jgi:hypothetical protein